MPSLFLHVTDMSLCSQTSEEMTNFSNFSRHLSSYNASLLLSYDDFLEVKSGDYQNCCVCCVVYVHLVNYHWNYPCVCVFLWSGILCLYADGSLTKYVYVRISSIFSMRTIQCKYVVRICSCCVQIWGTVWSSAINRSRAQRRRRAVLLTVGDWVVVDRHVGSVCRDIDDRINLGVVM